MNKKIITIICAILVAFTTAFSVSAGSSGKSTVAVKGINPIKPIKIEGGKITGMLSSDSKVAVYKGIPYAAPPVEELRWKEPQPVIPWKGVKAATKFGPNAIQPAQAPFLMWSKEFIVDTSLGYSEEDSLTLNVWTKTESSKNKRPVVVYLHGGGFSSGGSSVEVYDGEAIAKKDVVYVNINYRLGILGFLGHRELSAESEDGVSGNYGILDQIAALEWVKNNIEKFGGDPDNVTIAGQSAGASTIHNLIVSPKAKGLFKNAITMGDNNINNNHSQTLAQKEEVASKLFEGKTLVEMRAMSTEELLAIPFTSLPTVDGVVIPNNLLDTLKEGRQNDVNLMTGMIKGDTLIFGPLPVNLRDPATSMTRGDFEQAVKAEFGSFADKVIATYPVTGDEAIDQYNAINEDILKVEQYYLAKARALKGHGSTYVYYFDHVMPGENSAKYGAFHTAEVPYFLNNFSPLRKSHWTQTDYDLGDKMSSYLVNFAKSGNPNGEGLEKWGAFKGDMSYINFGDTISKDTLSEEKAKLWKEYYESLLGI